jgi:LysM repeat protein
MVAVAKAGDLGIDSSSFRMTDSGGKLDADKTKAFQQAKGKFFFRYSAGAGNGNDNTQWKLCGPDEIARLTQVGDFIANSEWYEDRVEEGASAGKADGAADLKFWKSRGYAKGGVIFVSWDKAPDHASYDDVEDYLQAYDKALQGYYEVGLYAGSAAIREMKKRGVIVSGWQTMSTSWSDNNLPYQPEAKDIAIVLKNRPAGIDVWQTGNYWFNKGADENVMLTNNVLSHLRVKAGAKPPVKPPVKPVKPKPKPIPSGGTYRIRPSDSDGLIAVCHRHGISNWLAVARLNNIKGPNYVIHVGDVIRWPGGIDPKPASPKKAVYIVREGDTLSSIANRWGVSLPKLEHANPKAGHPAGNFDNIYPRDKIIHP